MILKKWLRGLFSLALGGTLAWTLGGCGGGMMNTPPVSQAQSGTVFISGSDAPLASVISFQVDITGISVTDANGNSQSVLNGTQTVDFARLNGLRTLLDINTIPAGTSADPISECRQSADESANASDHQHAQWQFESPALAHPILDDYSARATACRQSGEHYRPEVRVRHSEIRGAGWQRPDHGSDYAEPGLEGHHTGRRGCLH